VTLESKHLIFTQWGFPSGGGGYLTAACVFERRRVHMCLMLISHTLLSWFTKQTATTFWHDAVTFTYSVLLLILTSWWICS